MVPTGPLGRRMGHGEGFVFIPAIFLEGMLESFQKGALLMRAVLIDLGFREIGHVLIGHDSLLG